MWVNYKCLGEGSFAVLENGQIWNVGKLESGQINCYKWDPVWNVGKVPKVRMLGRGQIWNVWDEVWNSWKGRNLGPVSWRPMTVKWQQFSQSNCHSTISTRQTEYHEALPSLANEEGRCDCTFADDGNASWYSVCWVPMVEWRWDWKLLSLDGRRPPWYRPLDCRGVSIFGMLWTGYSENYMEWANDSY